MRLLLALSLAAVFAASGCRKPADLSGPTSITGENSGDPLRFIFRDAKGAAAKMIQAFKPELLTLAVQRGEISGIDAAKVLAFMARSQGDLAAELAAMPLIFGEGAPGQQSCAQTGSTHGDPVVLSYSKCKTGGLSDRGSGRNGIDSQAAARLLIHETVHHFGFGNSPADEDFADQIAAAVVGLAAHADPSRLVLDGFYIGSSDSQSGAGARSTYEQTCSMFKIDVQNLFAYRQVNVESIDCGDPVASMDGDDVPMATAISSYGKTVDFMSKAHVVIQLGRARPVQASGTLVDGDATEFFEGMALSQWSRACLYQLSDEAYRDGDRFVAGDCGEPVEIKPEDRPYPTFKYVSTTRLWLQPAR